MVQEMERLLGIHLVIIVFILTPSCQVGSRKPARKIATISFYYYTTDYTTITCLSDRSCRMNYEGVDREGKMRKRAFSILTRELEDHEGAPDFRISPDSGYFEPAWIASVWHGIEWSPHGELKPIQ